MPDCVAGAPCPGEFHPLIADRLHLLAGLPAPSLLGPQQTPEQVARWAAYDAPFGPVELPDVRVVEDAAPGPHGPVPLRIYHPLTDAGLRPALVWIHGGAWVFGDLDMPEGDHVARRVAEAADAVVVSIDYRLAVGGVHFPVPHDDVWAGYLWVREHAASLGIDPDRIAVGGGSAGGNLAASVALRGRDEGIPPWQSLLAYPALHPGREALADELAERLAKTPPVLVFGADDSFSMNYLGGPIEAATPYAFPGLTESLVDYPPTYVENAEFDTLRASGEDFAARLVAAGVEVEQVTVCGVPHGYLNRPGGPESTEACVRLAARLRR